jgi:hypothetical protein
VRADGSPSPVGNRPIIWFSYRDPGQRLSGSHAGKLLVAMYAWDSNSYPGPLELACAVKLCKFLKDLVSPSRYNFGSSVSKFSPSPRGQATSTGWGRCLPLGTLLQLVAPPSRTS